MPKIEVPTSVTLYVQCILSPFVNPKTAEQMSINSKWAMTQTKELLKSNSINIAEMKLAIQHNGQLLLEIHNPDLADEDGKEFWENVLNVLKSSEHIESIYIYVNNDISEKIAINLEQHVPKLWYTGYNGYNKNTLIYHR